ncbi:MAG TPA: carboxymuconolactone decarboxylase family protein [Oleiagrimonas sp.]|nr:carboxymuconolactone decarboxylase family protein [Oleiagrimonas sp.]
MTQRLNYYRKHAGALKHLQDLSAYVHQSSLEEPLVQLVFMRASQLNGCAYCMDMHSKDALAAGEDPMRLFVLPAWREADFYSDRERAALAWCEAVTRLDPQQGVPDEVYEQARAVFSEEELVDLDLAVVTINAWNRLAIPFRSEPGTYKPRSKH